MSRPHCPTSIDRSIPVNAAFQCVGDRPFERDILVEIAIVARSLGRRRVIGNASGLSSISQYVQIAASGQLITGP